MRKVEATMNSMIRNGVAWSDGNTCTTYDNDGNCLVYLHGNHIATVGDSFMAIFDGCYQSNTNKEFIVSTNILVVHFLFFGMLAVFL